MVFENFDLNEESKFHFIKLNVSQLIDTFHDLYSNINTITKSLDNTVSSSHSLAFSYI